MTLQVKDGDKIDYIYDLPYFERLELCKLLNQNDAWEELAGTWMKYDMLTIQTLQSERNPANELLELWGQSNHRIIELFNLLSRMQHYRAMIILKPFVDSKYHALIDQGEGNAMAILGRRKNLATERNNFNQVEPKVLSMKKIVLHDEELIANAKVSNKNSQLLG